MDPTKESRVKKLKQKIEARKVEKPKNKFRKKIWWKIIILLLISLIRWSLQFLSPKVPWAQDLVLSTFLESIEQRILWYFVGNRILIRKWPIISKIVFAIASFNFYIKAYAKGFEKANVKNYGTANSSRIIDNKSKIFLYYD